MSASGIQLPAMGQPEPSAAMVATQLLWAMEPDIDEEKQVQSYQEQVRIPAEPKKFYNS